MFIIRILYMDNKPQNYTNDDLIKELYDNVTYFDEY